MISCKLENRKKITISIFFQRLLMFSIFSIIVSISISVFQTIAISISISINRPTSTAHSLHSVDTIHRTQPYLLSRLRSTSTSSLLWNLLWNEQTLCECAGAACSSASQPSRLTSFSGLFVSLNYPFSYDGNSDCRWLIISPEAYAVSTSFSTWVMSQWTYRKRWWKKGYTSIHMVYNRELQPCT